MLRPLLCALAVAGACTASNKPAKPAAGAPADARANPASPAQAAVEQPRALVPPPVLGEPFYRPGDRAQQIDAFTFWG